VKPRCNDSRTAQSVNQVLHEDGLNHETWSYSSPINRGLTQRSNYGPIPPMAKRFEQDDTKQVGLRLAAYRQVHNLRQEDVASAVGVSSQAVGNWEQGVNLFAVLSARRLVDRYGGTLDWFYRGSLASVGEIGPALLEAFHRLEVSGVPEYVPTQPRSAAGSPEAPIMGRRRVRLKKMRPDRMLKPGKL
jgi:transcriptional regulator with XRE-family HTH domain